MYELKDEPKKDVLERLKRKLKVLGIFFMLVGLGCLAVAVLSRDTSFVFLALPGLGIMGIGWYLYQD